MRRAKKAIGTGTRMVKATPKATKSAAATMVGKVKAARGPSDTSSERLGLLAALEPFVSLVNARLNREVVTTEDSFRDPFFAAAIEQGVADATSVVLEMPSVSDRAQTSTRSSPTWPGGPPWVLEFKCFRRTPSGQNAPRTQLAGERVQ